MQVSEKLCHNKVVGVRHPSGAIWCTHCNHYTLTDYQSKCLCCFRVVPKRQHKYLTDLKKFDEVIDQNQKLIEAFIEKPCTGDYMPNIAMKLGFRIYLISLKWFAEYYKLNRTKDPNIIGPFLQKVKDNSSLLMPSVKVV